MNNKGILILIAVILVGILGVMVVQGGFLDNRTPLEKAADNVGDAVRNTGDAIGEAAEEVGDEIDDHTTAR